MFVACLLQWPQNCPTLPHSWPLPHPPGAGHLIYFPRIIFNGSSLPREWYISLLTWHRGLPETDSSRLSHLASRPMLSCTGLIFYHLGLVPDLLGESSLSFLVSDSKVPGLWLRNDPIHCQCLSNELISLTILTDGYLRKSRCFTEKEAEIEKIMQTPTEELRNSGIHGRQMSDLNFSTLSLIPFPEEFMKVPNLFGPFLRVVCWGTDDGPKYLALPPRADSG